MQVELPPALAQFVQDLVSSGEYASETEVIQDAVRHLKRVEDLAGTGLAELREEVRIGIQAADEGRMVDFDETVLAQIKAAGRTRLQAVALTE